MIWPWKWWGSVGIYGIYEESEDGHTSRFSKKGGKIFGRSEQQY